MDNYDENMPPGLGFQPAAPPQPAISPQAINSIDRYNGRTDARSWLTQFGEYADLYGWNGEVRVTVAKLRMKETAAGWAQDRSFHSWPDFQSKFLDRFGLSADQASVLLTNCKQSDAESVKEYSDRFTLYARTCGRLLPDSVEDTPLVQQFIDGLHKDLQLEVKRKELRSIDAIVRFCNYWLGWGPTSSHSIGRSSPNSNINSHTVHKNTVRFSDEPYVYPISSTNRSYQDHRWPDSRAIFPDRPAVNKAAYRPIPLQDSTNRSYSPPSPGHNGDSRRSNPKSAPTTSEPASSGKGIDDLVKRFDKLEIHLQQVLRVKDKELRHLHHAVRRQEGSPTINLMQEVTTSTAPPSPEELHFLEGGYIPGDPEEMLLLEECPYLEATYRQDEEFELLYTEDDPAGDDIDEEYLSEFRAYMGLLVPGIYAEHARDDYGSFHQRMPRKRSALNVSAAAPYAPVVRPCNSAANNSSCQQPPVAVTSHHAHHATPSYQRTPQGNCYPTQKPPEAPRQMGPSSTGEYGHTPHGCRQSLDARPCDPQVTTPKPRRYRSSTPGRPGPDNPPSRPTDNQGLCQKIPIHLEPSHTIQPLCLEEIYIANEGTKDNLKATINSHGASKEDSHGPPWSPEVLASEDADPVTDLCDDTSSTSTDKESHEDDKTPVTSTPWLMSTTSIAGHPAGRSMNAQPQPQHPDHQLELQTMTRALQNSYEGMSTHWRDHLSWRQELTTEDFEVLTSEDQDALMDSEEDSVDEGGSSWPDLELNWSPGPPLEQTGSLDNHGPIRILIDGNLGSGKSTVISYAEQQLTDGWRVVSEPVFAWQNLLPALYAAPPRSAEHIHIAAMLQVAMLNGYAFHTPEFSRAPKIVLERGPWSSLEVFLPDQQLPAYLDSIVYEAAYNIRASLQKALPTAVIYLDADPAICLQRISARQRPGEQAVKLEYLQQLDQAYRAALDCYAGPKVIIDATQDHDTVAKEVLAAVQILSGSTSPSQQYSLPLSRQTSDWLTRLKATRTFKDHPGLVKSASAPVLTGEQTEVPVIPPSIHTYLPAQEGGALATTLAGQQLASSPPHNQLEDKTPKAGPRQPLVREPSMDTQVAEFNMLDHQKLRSRRQAKTSTLPSWQALEESVDNSDDLPDAVDPPAPEDDKPRCQVPKPRAPNIPEGSLAPRADNRSTHEEPFSDGGHPGATPGQPTPTYPPEAPTAKTESTKATTPRYLLPKAAQGSPPIDLCPSDSDGLDAGTKRQLQQRHQVSKFKQVAVKLENNILALQERQKISSEKRHLTIDPAETMPPGTLVQMKAPSSSSRSKLSAGAGVEDPYRRVTRSTEDAGSHRPPIVDANYKQWGVHASRSTIYSTQQPNKSSAGLELEPCQPDNVADI